MLIKNIDTIYNGHKFRSRLEARWAIYFDVIGLKWDYEPEGYMLEDGTKYLPDFWFPQVNMWAEVKRGRFSENELMKVKGLVKGTKFPCLLLEGKPDERSYGVVELDKNNKVIVGDSGGCDCVISMYKDYPVNEHRFYSYTGEICDESFTLMFTDVRSAAQKANSARFEFGEEGI